MVHPIDFLPWLVSISFQAGILVLLILAVKMLLGRFLTPWWQFAIWFLVLARLVIPAGPESSLSLSNYISQSQWIGQPSIGAKSFHGFLRTPDTPGLSSSVITSTDNISKSSAVALNPTLDAEMLLVILWLFGTLTMLLILARNTRRLSATLRLARPIDDPAIIALFDACSRDARITRRVRLLTSEQITTPALAGLFRPVVLLPEDALSTTSAAELKFIILHELIHLRRGDLIVGCAAGLLQAVHWFNPLIWIGFYRMRADREIACDAEVMKILGRKSAADYGRTILKLAEQASAPRFFAGSIGIIEVKSETGRRITMITQHRQHSGARALCGFAIAAIIAAVSFTEAQTQTPVAEKTQTPQSLSVTGNGGFSNIEEQPKQNQYPEIDAKITTATLESLLNPEILAPVERPQIVMDGTKPFTLTVDESVGELVYTFNEKTKALESIEGKKGVVFSTEGTTISCDNLVYNSSTQELVATGPGLEVSLGELRVTADKLTYQPDEGPWFFDGDVTILQRDKDGKVTEFGSKALEIYIDSATGKYRMIMRTGTGDKTYVRQTNAVEN